MTRLPTHRPVTVDDVQGPSWTDAGISPERIAANRVQRALDRATARFDAVARQIADVADRLDKLERDQRRRP